MQQALPQIELDIVSDIVCPWCIVGFNRMNKAIEMVSDKLQVNVHWHPFLLNPDVPETGTNYKEHISKKYGKTFAQVDEMRQGIINAGKEHGFIFNYFAEMKTFNTFRAHQLIHYARLQGKEQELKLRLLTAFFNEKKDVSDFEILVNEAVNIGLDKKESEQVLEDSRYANAVQEEMDFWRNLGISSVPTYVINKSQAIAGAHDPHTLANILLEIGLSQ